MVFTTARTRVLVTSNDPPHMQTQGIVPHHLASFSAAPRSPSRWHSHRRTIFPHDVSPACMPHARHFVPMSALHFNGAHQPCLLNKMNTILRSPCVVIVPRRCPMRHRGTMQTHVDDLLRILPGARKDAMHYANEMEAEPHAAGRS